LAAVPIAKSASLTVTEKLECTGLLASSLSVAVQVTVVTPTGNVEPEAWSQTTVGVSPDSSVAVGALNVTAAPAPLVA
jgi:hypothetical protein